MSDSGGGSLLCGFWGNGSGAAGLAWRLGGSAGAIFAREPEPGADLAEVSVSGELDDPGDAVEIDFGGLDLAVELSPLSAAVALETTSPEAGEAGRAALCEARLRSEGAEKQERARGFMLRWPEDPGLGAGLFRALALQAPEGAALLLTARREPGAKDHASEATTAWLLEPDGRVTPFEEALLSTQYDGEGLQTRVGLELWPKDAEMPPTRAAATTFGLSAGEGIAAALMRSSAEGTEGIGAYLIRRP